MSPPDKKPVRGAGTQTLRSNKSPIATPPRTFQGRSSKPESHNTTTPDTASTKSSISINADAPSDSEDAVSSVASLAEKDRKIVELENEIAVMTSEFSRELTLLSHKLTNESEALHFWQAKHTALSSTYTQTDTSLKHLQSELSSSTTTQEQRERDVKTRISSLVLDRDAFREAYNEAMGEVREREELVRMLQGQVRGLKSWVVSSGRGGVGEQVSDEGLGEEMRRVGNGVQNWVITHFRRVRIDIDKADSSTREALENLVPTYESLASSSKVHLIQSLLSRLLVTHIFDAYFVGITPEQATEFSNVEEHLGTFGSPESLNQWRSTTLSIIHKNPSSMSTHTNTLLTTITTEFNALLTSISDTVPNPARDSTLRTLLTSCIDLSRLLRVQKAVFTVMMPIIEGHQRTMFDTASMEDVGGEDEETLSEREIRCVTFPGIAKAGDENGERGHLRNVVAKVRVLCAPD